MSASDQDQQVAGRWGAARRRRRRRAETQAFPVGVNVKAAPAPFGRTKVSVGTDAWYDKDDTEKIWGSSVEIFTRPKQLRLKKYKSATRCSPMV